MNENPYKSPESIVDLPVAKRRFWPKQLWTELVLLVFILCVLYLLYLAAEKRAHVIGTVVPAINEKSWSIPGLLIQHHNNSLPLCPADSSSA